MTPRAARSQGLLVAGTVPALAYARRAVKALQQREAHHHPLRAAVAAAWRLLHHAVAQLRGPSHVQVRCPPPSLLLSLPMSLLYTHSVPTCRSDARPRPHLHAPAARGR